MAYCGRGVGARHQCARYAHSYPIDHIPYQSHRIFLNLIKWGEDETVALCKKHYHVLSLEQDKLVAGEVDDAPMVEHAAAASSSSAAVMDTDIDWTDMEQRGVRTIDLSKDLSAPPKRYTFRNSIAESKAVTIAKHLPVKELNSIVHEYDRTLEFMMQSEIRNPDDDNSDCHVAFGIGNHVWIWMVDPQHHLYYSVYVEGKLKKKWVPPQTFEYATPLHLITIHQHGIDLHDYNGTLVRTIPTRHNMERLCGTETYMYVSGNVIIPRRNRVSISKRFIDVFKLEDYSFVRTIPISNRRSIEYIAAYKDFIFYSVYSAMKVYRLDQSTGLVHSWSVPDMVSDLHVTDGLLFVCLEESGLCVYSAFGELMGHQPCAPHYSFLRTQRAGRGLVAITILNGWTLRKYVQMWTFA